MSQRITPDREVNGLNAGQWGKGKPWGGAWPSTLLDPSEYDNDERLTEDALVLIESGGKPDAVNDTSSARGILQITNALARDFGLSNSDELLGKVDLSREVFRWHMNNLRDNTHGGDPVLMALAWNNGGAGCRRIQTLAKQQNLSLSDATKNYVYNRERTKRNPLSVEDATKRAEEAKRYIASLLVKREELRARINESLELIFSKDSVFGIDSSEARKMYTFAKSISSDDNPLEAREKWVLKLEGVPLDQSNETIPDLWESAKMERFVRKDNFYECLIILNKIPKNDSQIYELLREALDVAIDIFADKFHNFHLFINDTIKKFFFIRDYKIDSRGNGKLKVIVRTPVETPYFLEPDQGYEYFSIDDAYGVKDDSSPGEQSSTYTLVNLYEYVSKCSENMSFFNDINEETKLFQVNILAIQERFETFVKGLIDYINDYKNNIDSVVFKFDPSNKDSIKDISLIDSDGNRLLVSVDYKYLLEDLGAGITETHLMRNLSMIYSLDRSEVDLIDFVFSFIRPIPESICDDDISNRISNRSGNMVNIGIGFGNGAGGQNSNINDRDLRVYAKDTGSACKSVPEIKADIKNKIKNKILKINSNISAVRELTAIERFTQDQSRSLITSLRKNKDISLASLLTLDIPNILNNFFICEFGFDLSCSSILKQNVFGDETVEDLFRLQTLKELLFETNKEIIDSFVEDTKKDIDSFYNLANNKYKKKLTEKRDLIREIISNIKTEISVEFDYDRDGNFDRIKDFTREVTIRALVRSLPRIGYTVFSELATYVNQAFDFIYGNDFFITKESLVSEIQSRIEQTLADDSQNITDLNKLKFINSFIDNIYYDFIDELLTPQIFDELFTASYPWFSPEIDGTGKAINVAASRIIFKLSETFDINISTQSESAQNLSIPLDPRIASELSEYSFIDTSNELENVENLFKGEVERIIKDYDEIVIYESNDEIIQTLSFRVERRKNKVITELSKTIDKLSVGFIEQQNFIELFDKLSSEIVRDIEKLADINFEDSFTFSLENLAGFELLEYFDDYEENLINLEYNNSLQEAEKLKGPIEVIETNLDTIADYVPGRNEPIADVNFGNLLPIGGAIESIRSFAKGGICLTNVDFLSKNFCGIRFGAAFRFRMPFINYLPILDLKFGRFEEFERIFDLAIRQFFTSLRLALMIALEKSCEDREDDGNTGAVELLDPLPVDNSVGFVESLADSRGIDPYNFAEEIERFARRLSTNYSPIELCLSFSREAGNDLLNIIYTDLRDFERLSGIIQSQAELELLLASMGLDFGLDSCSRYFERNNIDSSFEERIISRSPRCLDDLVEISRTRLIDLGVPESIANLESKKQIARSNQLSDLIKDLVDNPIGEDFFNNCPEALKEQGLDGLREDSEFFISQYVSKFNDAVRSWPEVFFEIRNEKREVDIELAKEVLDIDEPDGPNNFLNPVIKNLINLGVDEDIFRGEDTAIIDTPARVFNDSFVKRIEDSRFANDSYFTLLPSASQTFENTLRLIYKDNDVPAEFTNLLESRYKSLNYDFGTSEDKIILRGNDKRVYNLENDIDSLMFDENIDIPYFAQTLNGLISDKASFSINNNSKYFLSEFVNFYKEHLQEMLSRNQMIRKVNGEYLIEYLGLDSSSSKCGSPQDLLRKEDIINKSIDRAADKCSQDDVKDFYESAMSLTNVDLFLRISVIEFLLNNFIIFANYKSFFVNKHITELITESVLNFLQTLDDKTYDEFTNKIDKDITEYIEDYIRLNASDISYRMNNIFGFELYDFDANSTFHYINSLQDLGYGYLSLPESDLSPKLEYPGGLYKQKYYRVKLSDTCPGEVRDSIISEKIFKITDEEEVFISEDEFFAVLDQFIQGYGRYDIREIFSIINLGIRIVYVTNNPDVGSTLVDLEGGLNKMKLGRYEGTDATFLPIISAEYPITSVFNTIRDIDASRLTSSIYQNLLQVLSVQQSTVDLFEKHTPYSNLLMYSILYNKTFYEQTTEIEDVFFSVKRSIVNGATVISNFDNFDNDGNPEIMKDSIEFDKIIESLLNPESRDWLPEFLNPNKDRVKALEAVMFALKAAREASRQIFKAYVEFSDPNISIASKIHNFSGKRVPIIGASLGLLPANVFPPPIGLGPPLTPAGFIYLALFGLDFSFLFNTEEDRTVTSIEKAEEC